MKSTLLLTLILFTAASGSSQAQAQQRSRPAYRLPSAPPNPDAPDELSTFDFLIGRWNCEVVVRQVGGGTAQLEGTWEGRYILDGYVIADEFRMRDDSGSLIMLGMNYRAYDDAAGSWSMKWLEALSGTWLELGPPWLGGVQTSGGTIEYLTEIEPGELHRIRFTGITDTTFTWSVDVSDDEGRSWRDSVMVIRARRAGRP